MSGEFDKVEAERLAREIEAPFFVTPRLREAVQKQLRAAIERIGELENRVLVPLTAEQVKRALHEGRAEAMAATGDNAWATLVSDRDRFKERVGELESLVNQACDWLEARTDKQARTFHAAHIRAALAKEDT